MNVVATLVHSWMLVAWVGCSASSDGPSTAAGAPNSSGSAATIGGAGGAGRGNNGGTLQGGAATGAVGPSAGGTGAGSGAVKASGGSGGGISKPSTGATSGQAVGGASNVGGQSATTNSCSSVLAGDVSMSVPSGTFQGTLSLTLSTTASGAEIRFTTDGKTPTAASTLYSAPLSITKTTRVRAAAFVNGSAAGKPSAALYIARSIDSAHDLPIIVLDSFGSGKLPTSSTGDRPFVDVGFLSYEPSGGTASLAATPTTASFAAFHVRGNSSAMFDKIPYRLELRDEAGEDRDCAMLGMPAESDWALVGPHADKTLIHNNFVYDLGRALGLQVPRIKLAEVYVNVDNTPLDADDYQGVYQVVETIKNQKDRLNLKQLDETKTTDAQISGGYIFKFEWMITAETPLDCPATSANCWKAMELVDPIPIAPVQKTWLTQHLVSFNDSLHGTNIADPTTGYPKYMEVKSFVDSIIVSEFTRNMDAYARSQYFYKDRDAKINAGPLWDFDLIAGTGMKAGGMFGGMPGGTSMANVPTDGWQYEGNASRLKGATADWITVLVADPTFKAQLVARWKELRKTLLSDTAVGSRIDAVSAGLAKAAERNFKKWNILTAARIEPFDTPTEATWEGQITYMKTWLQQRAAWIDGQWK